MTLPLEMEGFKWAKAHHEIATIFAIKQIDKMFT
jgi:hypothetical protein